jgi:hypothetical protein
LVLGGGCTLVLGCGGGCGHVLVLGCGGGGGRVLVLGTGAGCALLVSAANGLSPANGSADGLEGGITMFGDTCCAELLPDKLGTGIDPTPPAAFHAARPSHS